MNGTPFAHEHRPHRRSARAFAPVATACAVAAAIVVALAVVAWPHGDQPAPSPTPATGSELAASGGRAGAQPAAESTPAAAMTATPHAVHDVNLDLGPIFTATPRPTTQPTATPTVAPTATPKRPTLSDKELVVDGGFEADDASWYTEPNGEIATGDAHDGSGELLLERDGYADQHVPVEAGASYRLTAWVKLSTAGDIAQIGVRYEDGNDNRIAPDATIAKDVSAQGWTKVVFTFTPPAETAHAVISFWFPDGAGTLAVDDVSVRMINRS